MVDATAVDATPRMYRSNLELRPHSDITAMIALACWHKSHSGGARNGQLPVRYQRSGIAAGQREMNLPLADEDIEALKLFADR